MNNEKIKEEIQQLVTDAKKSSQRLAESIPQCDAFKLSYFVGDVSEARGAAATLIKLYPDDPKVQQIWKDAAEAHILGNKARDSFITECYCRKKIGASPSKEAQ